MNYAEYVTRIGALIEPTTLDFNWATIVPALIETAEDKCYRDLNLLATRVADSSALLTANSRTITLPIASGRFVTVFQVNVITPVGSTVANGTRNPLTRVWRSQIDYLYPTETAPSNPSVPVVYDMLTDQIVVVGPAPNATYRVEFVGTIRPTPLSPANQTTFLTSYLPEVFFAASMETLVEMNAVPAISQPGQVWQTEYQTLVASASAEETRRRYSESAGATPR